MKKVIVETSARHVHVTKEDLETLFGKGYTLTPKKNLSQPGQFACEERVTLIGPKNEMKNVSILGPERNATQEPSALLRLSENQAISKARKASPSPDRPDRLR